MRLIGLLAALAGMTFLATADARADEPGAEKVGHLKHVDFDVKKKQVRVECEALAVNAPLEFFCCVRGTNEHESVLRTEAKPSDIQIGMLAVGLQPGSPITYDQAANKWLPPHGPPLYISIEFEKEGKTVTYPAYRWLRNMKTKKEPSAFAWIYAGSRVMPDGRYAADVTGYVVSIVNFDLTMIDVSELASSANESLEWERNADLMPKVGTKVTMIIEPLGNPAAPKAAMQDGTTGAPVQYATTTVIPPLAAAEGQSLSPVKIDEQRVKELRALWEAKVAPRSDALRQAAQAHYEVIAALRHEQQRLVQESDRIQRTIDELERDYQELTTPHPKIGE